MKLVKRWYFYAFGSVHLAQKSKIFARTTKISCKSLINYWCEIILHGSTFHTTMKYFLLKVLFLVYNMRAYSPWLIYYAKRYP